MFGSGLFLLWKFALLEVYQSTKLRFALKEVALNKVLLSVYAIMKFFFLPSYVSLKQNSLSNVNFLKQNNHFKIRHGSREPSPFYLSWRAIFELISESLEKVYFMVQMPFRRLATLKRHLLDKPYNHLSVCAGRVAPSNGHSSNYCNYFCIKCARWNKKKGWHLKGIWKIVSPLKKFNQYNWKQLYHGVRLGST